MIIMDITALAQILFRLEFQRLLLIVGTLVATIVVSQCIALTFSYGKMSYFLSGGKDSTTMIIANADSSNHSKLTKITVVQVVANSSVALDSEDEVGFDDEIVDNEDTDYELALEVDNNSNKKFGFEKGDIDLSIRFEVESDIVRGNVSAQGNRMEEKYEKDTTFTRTKSSEDRNQVGKGVRNLTVGDSAKNVEQNRETQPKDRKIELVRSNSEHSVMAGMLMPKRRDKKPTTILQMNMLLLWSPLSICST